MFMMAGFRADEKKFDRDQENGLHPSTSIGVGTQRRASISDAVFGEINDDGPNYRAVWKFRIIVLTRVLTDIAYRWGGRELLC